MTSGVVGVQFSIAKLAHIYVGTGVGLLTNESMTRWGLVALDGGLSFTIPTPRTRRSREAQAAAWSR